MRYVNPHDHAVDCDGRPVPPGGQVDTSKATAELLGLQPAKKKSDEEGTE